MAKRKQSNERKRKETGRLLKSWRKEANLTQSNLANLLKNSVCRGPSLVFAYESGNTQTPINFFLSAAPYLGKSFGQALQSWLEINIDNKRNIRNLFTEAKVNVQELSELECEIIDHIRNRERYFGIETYEKYNLWDEMIRYASSISRESIEKWEDHLLLAEDGESIVEYFQFSPTIRDMSNIRKKTKYKTDVKILLPNIPTGRESVSELKNYSRALKIDKIKSLKIRLVDPTDYIEHLTSFDFTNGYSLYNVSDNGKQFVRGVEFSCEQGRNYLMLSEEAEEIQDGFRALYSSSEEVYPM